MPQIHLRYTFVSGFLLKLIENKHYDIVWGWRRRIVFSRHYDETKSNHNFNIRRHKPRGRDLEGLSACPSGWEPCDLYGNKYCRARSPPGRLTQMLFHSWGARCQLHLESVRVALFKSVNTYFEKAINISQGSRVTLPPPCSELLLKRRNCELQTRFPQSAFSHWVTEKKYDLE